MLSIIKKIFFGISVPVGIYFTCFYDRNSPAEWYDDLINLVILVFVLIGLFGFCWNKKIFSQIFWRIFLLIIWMGTVVSSLVFPVPEYVGGPSGLEGIAACFFLIWCIILFIYAFPKLVAGEQLNAKGDPIPRGVVFFMAIFLVGVVGGFDEIMIPYQKAVVAGMTGERQMRLLDNPEYRDLNITTPAALNDYWTKRAAIKPLQPILNLIQMAFSLLLFYGFWRGQNWSRLFMLVVGGWVSLIFTPLVFIVPQLGGPPVANFILGAAWSIFLIYYFTRPHVEAYFTAEEPS